MRTKGRKERRKGERSPNAGQGSLVPVKTGSSIASKEHGQSKVRWVEIHMPQRASEYLDTVVTYTVSEDGFLAVLLTYHLYGTLFVG